MELRTKLTKRMSRFIQKFEMFYASRSMLRESGQALVEAIIAIGVLTVGLLGITALLSNALGTNRVVADNYTATYLASEGIEIVKNIIDANETLRARNGGSFPAWNQNVSPGTYEVEYSKQSLEPGQSRFLCFDGTFYGYVSCGTQGAAQTSFKRRIVIAWPTSDEIMVNSIVDWTTRGGGTFSVNLEDHFMNWRP